MGTAVKIILSFLVLTSNLYCAELDKNIWLKAGYKYHIDPMLLYAIAKVESDFDANAITYNKNGTVDYGIMQINSIHLKELSKYSITKDALLNDPNLNVMIGAWELSGCINRLGYNWMAVNCYNGLDYNNRVNNVYAKKVYKALIKAQAYAEELKTKSGMQAHNNQNKYAMANENNIIKEGNSVDDQ